MNTLIPNITASGKSEATQGRRIPTSLLKPSESKSERNEPSGSQKKVMWRYPLSRIQPLRLPILNAPQVKLAELSARTTFVGGHAFPASRWHELKSFGPNILAGSLSEVRRLIERMDLRTLELPSVDHAIFVLTEIGDKPLTGTMRTLLWQRFAIPVYELYMGPQRQLLARECEALEGWHVEPGIEFAFDGEQLLLTTSDEPLPTGLGYKLEQTPCGCGRPGTRILPYLEPALNAAA
jgi:hypothetical protein